MKTLNLKPMMIALLLALLGLSNMALNAAEPKIWFEDEKGMVNGKSNEMLSYQFTASTDQDLEVVYEFYETRELMKGMAIDSKTGLFTWNSTFTGEFFIGVKAYFKDKPEIFAQTFLLITIDGKERPVPCATIKGKVELSKDGKTYPIVNASVFAISLDPNNYDAMGMTTTDKDGNYTMEVPESAYNIAAMVNSMSESWWNSKTKENADTVLIKCNDSFTANFTLNYDDSLEMVYFTNMPDKYTIIVGETYTFKWEAKSNFGSDVKFKIVDGPSGMTLDEDGNMSWTPTEEMQADFTIKAYVPDNPKAETQLFWGFYAIDKSRIEKCAYIKGTVKDEKGNLLENAYIGIMQANMDRKIPWYEQNEMIFTDSKGEYTIYVPKGEYLLYVSGENIISEWYKDAKDPMTAEVVKIECNDTYNADFTVETFKMPEFFIVRGKVTSEDNKALPSFIQFMPDKNNNNKYYYNLEAFARTDADGNYETKIAAGIDYKAVATTDNYDYLPTFYNGKLSWDEATIINIDKETNGIDFIMKSKPVYNNGLYGKVVDSADFPIYGWVTAIPIEMEKGWYYDQRSTFTDTVNLGEFTLKNLVPGKYVLYASAERYEKYMPGYYVKNDFATWNWDEATVIDVPTEGMINFSHVIKLNGMIKFDGLLLLSGKVTDPDGNGISGAQVIAFDKYGNAAQVTTSGNEGVYKLDKLGVGDYKVVAAKAGYENVEKTMDFNTSDKSSRQNNFILSKKATGIKDDNSNSMNLSVYPNPAASNAVLSFTGIAGNARLSIYNALGNEMLSKEVTINQGTNTLALDISTLPTGSYLIKISGTNNNFNTGLQIVR